MNELATSSDVRDTTDRLERKMDEMVDDLKREMRKVKRETILGFTITMAAMNMVMIFALDATLNV
jgi:hypothetical protein